MEQRPGTAESAVPAPLLFQHADKMTEYLVRFNNRGRLANWALGIPGLVVRGATWLLVRLTLPGARRAEFQADAVAARIASTQAAVSALRDRHLADVVNVEANRLAIAAHTFSRTRAGQSTDPDFWAKVAAHVAALPDSERERLHGVDLSNVTTADSDPLGSPAKDSGLPIQQPACCPSVPWSGTACCCHARRGRGGCHRRRTPRIEEPAGRPGRSRLRPHLNPESWNFRGTTTATRSTSEPSVSGADSTADAKSGRPRRQRMTSDSTAEPDACGLHLPSGGGGLPVDIAGWHQRRSRPSASITARRNRGVHYACATMRLWNASSWWGEASQGRIENGRDVSAVGAACIRGCDVGHRDVESGEGYVPSVGLACERCAAVGRGAQFCRQHRLGIKRGRQWCSP